MELVIMAAGLGSRFGGLKQLEPVDSHGNFIIDYSIYDAIRVGFKKVIFIIKKENLEIFKNTIGNRIAKHIEIEYVFQENKTNNKIELPSSRIKPLGTGHAVLSAKPVVSSNFAVINADDYYGIDAFEKLAEFLKANNNESKYCLVGYSAINTMSGEGSVKRGVCKIENDSLKQITESSIFFEDDKLMAQPLQNESLAKYEIDKNETVSMNMFGFTKSFMNHLEIAFEKFLTENQSKLETAEFFLPTVVSDLINENKASSTVLKTTSTWHGITYREDKQKVCDFIYTLKNQGLYPENLWQK